MSDRKKVIVIGGGLAGSEAAWQLASRGVAVDLYEMRPVRPTHAHHTDKLAELVCSNSLGSFESKSASSLLKEELKILGSKVLSIAVNCRVPAGQALAVDREAFAQQVTQSIQEHPLITLRREEFPELDPGQITVVASGPLTSDTLVASITKLTGAEQLHFFDAASPILTKESIDLTKVFSASRYDNGEGEYLNCPMNEAEYAAFHAALVAAEKVELKDFEKDTPFFEACLPIEEIGRRGLDTMRFGPLKPVGLLDPQTEKRPWAVVQLRQDNAAADLYNIVGFQTNLKWGEQQRVFKMIPGLEKAEFVRLGVMHRNTYLNTPEVLLPTLQMKNHPNIFFGGQLTGVEGYTESTATGLIAALNAFQLLSGHPVELVNPDTMIGALIRYITSANPKHFQPINSNWGILDTPDAWRRLPKPDKHAKQAERALSAISQIAKEVLLV